jgi:hypothetical protein
VADEHADVLTADKPAKYLRVRPRTLDRPVAAGPVPGQRVGRAWRYRRSESIDFLQAKP